MNNSIKCGLLLACMTTVGFSQDLAMNQSHENFQQRKITEVSKRSDNYRQLKALG